jgi:hypothetical protein
MRLFTQHPKEQGMTYFGHLLFVLKNFSILLACTCVLIVHGVFPFVWKTFVSDRIEIKSK